MTLRGRNCYVDGFTSLAEKRFRQLRLKMNEIMTKQGHEEETGSAKITSGYNLPAKYILHTVGPIVQWTVTATDEKLLASCYLECLKLAAEHGVESVAFCCISTGGGDRRRHGQEIFGK